MSAVINRYVQEVYEEEACYSCGMVFFIPKQWRQNKLNDKSTFYCPNGHNQAYTGESASDKAARLTRELESAKASQRFAETILANERVNHTKQVKRIQKRTAAGTCPCCHRTVSQMARHMKAKHPEFGK